MTDAPDKLTDAQKEYIIERLARHEAAAAIAQGVFAEFGVRITHQVVRFYDPTTVSGRKAGRRWQALFWERRRKVLAERGEISFASKASRLFALDQLASRALATGNSREARALMAQIAKEAEEPSGGPTHSKDMYDFTDDELRAIVAQGRVGTATADGCARQPDRVLKRGRNPRKAGQ
jgi:hypothetical protein